MRLRLTLWWLLATVVGLSGASCRRAEGADQPAMVFAAASLTAAFQAVAAEFEHKHPGKKLDLHFAGTPQLVVQVREGAAADVFASADEANMEKIVQLGLTAAPPRAFAKNRLAIVTAKGNPKKIAALADLARAELRVALCGPEVPAGRYARQAHAKAGVAVRSVSDEPNVKAIVSKVKLGELDAGVVYTTDASADAAVTAVEIPAEHNVVATYPVALLTTGKSRATGALFVEFLLSGDGERVLRSFGFERP